MISAESLLSVYSDRIESVVISRLRSFGIRCRQTAADLAQEVRLRIWEALESGQYDPVLSPMEHYISRAASNMVTDHVRSWRFRRSRGASVETGWLDCGESDREERPDRIIANREQLIRLQAILDGAVADGYLTEEQSLYVDAYLYHDGVQAFAAKDLGVSPQTFGNRFRRILAILREVVGADNE